MKAANLEQAIKVRDALRRYRELLSSVWSAMHPTIECVVHGEAVYPRRAAVEAMLTSEIERLESSLADLGVEE